MISGMENCIRRMINRVVRVALLIRIQTAAVYTSAQQHSARNIRRAYRLRF